MVTVMDINIILSDGSVEIETIEYGRLRCKIPLPAKYSLQTEEAKLWLSAIVLKDNRINYTDIVIPKHPTIWLK